MLLSKRSVGVALHPDEHCNRRKIYLRRFLSQEVFPSRLRSLQMHGVPGYISVHLTRLSENNGGQFPRQEVYDVIDGCKRFPAHLIGNMPIWGLKYQPDNRGPKEEEKVRRKISALVDYIGSLQAKIEK